MNFPKKDVIATGLVAVAGVCYLMWATGSSLPGLSGVRGTGTVVLALGFVASAIAVMSGFDRLLHGNRAYLATTSLIGFAAVIGGGLVLVAESTAGLAVVMVAMVALWLIASVHHSLLQRVVPPTRAGTMVR